MILSQVTQFLNDIFVQGFAGLLLFRFLLQWLRAPMHNPVGEFIMAISDFAVLRARRFIPPVWRLDSSSLLLALCVEMIYLGLTLSIEGYPFVHFPLLMSALVAQAILSWVNPFTPLAPLLAAITYRFLRPLQRIVPLIGNVDLSPLLLLVFCQIILLVPLQMLESLAVRLL
jgi:YggT family protein